MRWQPDPDDRSAWSAAGGVVMGASGAGAIGWWLASTPATSTIPMWPVYVFVGIAAMGLYGVLAPLLRWWPWPGEDETTSGDVVTTPTQRSPLEAWLESRIEAHDVIARERAVRGEKEYQKQIGDWDTQNATELGGVDTKTLRLDSSVAIAPYLFESYLNDPQNPGHKDGIAPPHTPDIWDAYYMRRLAWLKGTLKRLREGNERPAATQEAKEPVSHQHRDVLKGVAHTLRPYVNASQHAYYGAEGDERKAQAFQEHFPEVAQRITAWNQQIAAFETKRCELEKWVEQRLRMLGYQQPPFAWGYAGLIAERAAAEGAELPFHAPQISPLWLHLGPYPLVPDPPPNGRTREGVEDELRDVLSEARQQPQCERMRQIRDSLSEASKRLTNDLDLIQAKDVINGLGDCVLCR